MVVAFEPSMPEGVVWFLGLSGERGAEEEPLEPFAGKGGFGGVWVWVWVGFGGASDADLADAGDFRGSGFLGFDVGFLLSEDDGGEHGAGEGTASASV